MSAAPVYGAGPIKPRRRQRATRAEMAHRHDRLYEITQAQQPTSIRFVFYWATNTGLHVPKSESGARMVQRAILAMRREGRLPWPWIVDHTRWMRKPTTWGWRSQLVSASGCCQERLVELLCGCFPAERNLSETIWQILIQLTLGQVTP